MQFLNTLKSVYKRSGSLYEAEESFQSDLRLKFLTSLVMSAASLLLTILNIVNQYWSMMIATALLVVGFLVCAGLCYFFKQRTICSALMSVLVAIVFTIFAVSGGNEGFAILWILLVPLIGMTLIGLGSGTILSLYFLLFLILFFYTPCGSWFWQNDKAIEEVFSTTFRIRFPLLYLTDFVTSFILAVQREFYYQKTSSLAFIDSMTGVSNRRCYDSMLKKMLSNKNLNKLSIISIDINRLKFINDTLGHEAGDELIKGSTSCMQKCFTSNVAICRLGGDEFSVLTFQPKETIEQQIASLLEMAASYKGDYIDSIRLAVGYASFADCESGSIDEVERLADAAMYRHKDQFYEETKLERRK